MRRIVASATLVVGLGSSTNTHAEDSATDRSAALDVVSSRETTWAWAWRGIFAADAIGEGALILAASSRADRIDLLSGVFKSTVALGATFVFPLAAVGDWRSRATTDAEISALLDRAAEKEAEGRAWPMHVLNIGFNVAVGGIAGEWSGRWSTAILGTIVGIGVGELELITQPKSAIDAAKSTVHVIAGPTFLGLAGSF
ncbi:MAG: hypothetical protein ACHREM_20035 [Polyangiales bacterium]